MTYRLATRRCPACHGKGFTSFRIKTMTVTTPCRPCNRTGRTRAWTRGRPARYYSPTP